MTKEEKHLGNMVRQAIEDSGCTLSEVARNIGISRQCLNGWLKRDDMSVKQLYLISEFLCDKLLDYYFLKQRVCFSCKIKDDTINNLNEVIKLKNDHSTSEKIKDFDKRGVRIFITYQSSNGKFGVECYRKKTVQESTGNGDWRMIRVGLIHSFETRELAEQEALLLAEDICKKFKF